MSPTFNDKPHSRLLITAATVPLGLCTLRSERLCRLRDHQPGCATQRAHVVRDAVPPEDAAFKRKKPEMLGNPITARTRVLAVAALILLSLSPTFAPAETRYTITDLGTLGTGLMSNANALSPSGLVTGSSLTDLVSNGRAYISGPGPMFGLGTLGGNYSEGYGINDAGQVVGVSRTADNTDHAFLYRDGTMMDLGTLGGATSTAFGINSAGQVVGMAARSDMSTHAFLYDGGHMIDLGSLGDLVDQSFAYAINDGGLIAGVSHTSTLELHAVVWSGGQITDLGTLGGLLSTAYGINNAGQVVGSAELVGRTGTHAFLYDSATMTDLGVLGQGRNSQAYAVNMSGKVVGSSEIIQFSTFTHAFLWSGGSMTNLNDLLPPGSGWLLMEAKCINEAGQIVGTGIAPGGFQHGFLLTPEMPSAPSSFYTVTPCRVADTRNPNGPLGGPALSGGAQRDFPITGTCSIPSTAKAVSVNITVTQSTSSGHLRLFPGGTPLPVVSAINYTVAQTRANNAILQLGPLGDLVAYCGEGPGTTTHFLLDVNGYFQ